ncbi:MAG: hypothetical protein ACM31G_07135 [Flavobacteriales bacterium]
MLPQSRIQGQILRDKGMNQAIETANHVHEKWSDKAFNFLLEFIKTNKVFMAEDVRTEAENKIEIPPSDRAWGGIMYRARMSGLIKRSGFAMVKNPKAHCTPATVWQVV